MTHATLLWSIWQALLQSFAWVFTRPGHRHFAEWVTGLALNVEEHTVTQSVTAIERIADWKAMETFAEYGLWDAAVVTRNPTRLVETAPGRTWRGYHVSAVDPPPFKILPPVPRGALKRCPCRLLFFMFYKSIGYPRVPFWLAIARTSSSQNASDSHSRARHPDRD